MEVHAHTHTPRKKWTHYLWEFLMLFLAVFCGFLAENFREHQVEHKREKQYMVSLVEDLETDTIELKKAMISADSTNKYIDSVLIFLNTNKITDRLPHKFAFMMRVAGQRLSLINTDRTSSQLKNSGAMRLIRNKQVADGILKYWKQIEKTNLTLERYLIYRNQGRDLSFKLFMWSEVYRRAFQIKEDSIQYLRIIDPDPKKWDEMINIIGGSGLIIASGHIKNLNLQYQLATELIGMIKKEYHLK